MRLFFLLILLIGVLLRIIYIGSVPYSMFGDEIDAGYNAYSLLKTGRDYNGNWLPTHIESMGDWRPFLYIYSLIPWIAVFDLSPFSVRISSAFWGVVTIFFVYKLAKSIWNPQVAIISASIISIIPWHLHYSRTGFEVTLMLGLVTLSWWLVLRSDKNPKYWIYSSAILGLSIYSYNIAKMLVPMIWGVFFLYFTYTQNIKLNSISIFKNKIIIISFLVFNILSFPLAIDLIKGSAVSRFSSLHIANDPSIVSEVVYDRHLDEIQGVNHGRIFHNKVTAIGLRVVSNYLSSFNPTFLFLTGQSDIPRHNLPRWGLLYIWMLPFVILGLYKLKNRPKELVIIVILLLTPIPSALTMGGGNHATRLSLMLIPLSLIVSLGIYNFIFNQNRFLIKLVLMFVIIFQLISYSHDYFFHYTQQHYSFWNYGWEKLFKTLDKHDLSDKKIIITRDHSHLPMLYSAFYNKIDPKYIHEAFSLAKNRQSPPPTDQIANFEFRTLSEYDPVISNAIYVSTYSQKLANWEVIDKIPNLDQSDNPVFIIWKPKLED